jgi:predicted nucleic acid-binding protein
MYLLDTNVVSELRKQSKANLGVQQFFRNAIAQSFRLYISAGVSNQPV